MNQLLRLLSTVLIITICFVTFYGLAQQVNSTNELSRRETMAKLVKIPKCRAYLDKYTSAISAKFSDSDTKSSPHDTIITAKFNLHQNGDVSDITVSGNTNSPAASICIKAIRECSPFPKWPDKMRLIVGKDYLEIHYSFGFNMTPPPPE
ncbi:MAG TPA: hypothetical protein VHY30_00990 [Verrucomicrobiae bacterium]|jgi:hypothetical protein|nr:hypothetical protein [Verrucomicrobiae bacterium]